MQTFLPYPDFMKSAEVLDKKRCWKQVIEAKQIINTLERKAEKQKKLSTIKIAWENHPAVKMWEGHITELQRYFNCFLDVCVIEHKIKTKYIPYTPAIEELLSENEPIWWLGNEYFHRAMRARLIEKDRNFYLPKSPEDEGFNGGRYLWPDMETETFKII